MPLGVADLAARVQDRSKSWGFTRRQTWAGGQFERVAGGGRGVGKRIFMWMEGLLAVEGGGHQAGIILTPYLTYFYPERLAWPA